MLAYQTDRGRVAIAVVLVQASAESGARAKGGIPNLLSDIFPGVSDAFTDELSPAMLGAKLHDWAVLYGVEVPARAYGALAGSDYPSLSTGMVDLGGRSTWPHAAWITFAPNGASVPLGNRNGIEVVDLFYPDTPALLVPIPPEPERATQPWLWLLGGIAGAFALAHVYGTRK